MDKADVLAWRQRLGFSQRRAAKELGVTLASFQAWEYGRVTPDRRTELAMGAVEAAQKKPGTRPGKAG